MYLLVQLSHLYRAPPELLADSMGRPSLRLNLVIKSAMPHLQQQPQ
jgi:hypothetical protein